MTDQGPETHHWDAVKTAEVARILAEHPPRAQWTASNVAQPPTAKDWCLDNLPLTVALGYPVRCPHCPQTASPVPPTHWTKHLQRHHPEAPVPEPTPATVHASPRKGSGAMPCCGRTPLEVPRTDRISIDPFTVTCSEPDTPGPIPAELREQATEALHAQMPGCTHDEHGADCGAIADAVLRVPAIAEALTAAAAVADIDRGYCPHCGRGDAAPSADQWLQERRRAEKAEATVRSWLPALRRAIDCLDTTCRYHGDQLDPDRFGRMTRSEACCDTGVEPRRAREARAALEAFAALDQQEQ